MKDRAMAPVPRTTRRTSASFVAVSACAALLVACALSALRAAAPAFDSGRAWEHLRQLVAIGPRPAGSPGIAQARAYIEAQLAREGVPVREQAWDAATPFGPVHMINLVATIPGRRADRIVVSGHYDTKLFHEFRFVGASDGGSSAAFLLELARVLKGRANPLTMELVFLDGEEAFCRNWDDCSRPGAPDNTYGSRHYVDVARQTGTLASLKANILVDMIGDRDLQIERDGYSTPWLTDIVWKTARARHFEDEFVERTTRIEDDHLAFLRAGVPSVDIIDLNRYADLGRWHTAADTLDAVSARSLQTVGDVVLAALPQIEAHLTK